MDAPRELIVRITTTVPLTDTVIAPGEPARPFAGWMDLLLALDASIERPR